MLGLLRGGSADPAAAGRGCRPHEPASPGAVGMVAIASPQSPSGTEPSNTRDFLDSCTSYGDLAGEAQMCHVMDALREQRSMLLHIIARLPPIEGMDARAAAADAGWMAEHSRGKPCPEVLPPSPEEWQPASMQRRGLLSCSRSSEMVARAARPNSPPPPSLKPPPSARLPGLSGRRAVASPTRGVPASFTEAEESNEQDFSPTRVTSRAHVVLQVEGESVVGPRGRGRVGVPAGEDGSARRPTLLDSARLRSSSDSPQLQKLERGQTDELSLQSSHASDYTPATGMTSPLSPSRSISSIERQHARRVAFREQQTGTMKSMKSRLGFVRRVDFDDSMVRMATTVRHTSHVVGPGRMQSGLTFLADCLDAMLSEGEPERTGRLNHIINKSKPFEVFCLSVIVFNGFFVGYTTNREMAYFDAHPSQDWSQVQAPQPPMEWLFIEVALVVWYCIELAMRLSVHKLHYFCNQDAKWNIMDFTLVAFSILDVIGNATQVGFFRLVRVFKVVKVLRTLRAMRFFQELRLMVDCMLGSFMQLLWCLVVIAFILYLFSLVFVQGMTDFLADLVAEQATLTTSQVDEYQGVVDHFGSVPHAMLLLLQSVTGGLDWFEIYDIILLSGGLRAAVYVFYILFFVVAIWNIITSVFVEKVLKLAQPDMDTLMLEQRRKDEADAKELRELFRKLDVDCSGTISRKEFERCIKNGEVENFLVGRGIDIKDAKTFFTMLSESMDMENGVDIGTVVGSCLRIKGVATSIDLQMLRYEARTAARKQAELTKVVNTLLVSLKQGPGGSSEYAALSPSPHRSSSSRARSRSRQRAEEPQRNSSKDTYAPGYYGLLTL